MDRTPDVPRETRGSRWRRDGSRLGRGTSQLYPRRRHRDGVGRRWIPEELAQRRPVHVHAARPRPDAPWELGRSCESAPSRDARDTLRRRASRRAVAGRRASRAASVPWCALFDSGVRARRTRCRPESGPRFHVKHPRAPLICQDRPAPAPTRRRTVAAVRRNPRGHRPGSLSSATRRPRLPDLVPGRIPESPGSRAIVARPRDVRRQPIAPGLQPIALRGRRLGIVLRSRETTRFASGGVELGPADRPGLRGPVDSGDLSFESTGSHARNPNPAAAHLTARHRPHSIDEIERVRSHQRTVSRAPTVGDHLTPQPRPSPGRAASAGRARATRAGAGSPSCRIVPSPTAISPTAPRTRRAVHITVRHSAAKGRPSATARAGEGLHSSRRITAPPHRRTSTRSPSSASIAPSPTTTSPPPWALGERPASPPVIRTYGVCPP